MRMTVVRQVWRLTVATTGKRLAPSPTAATCPSSSTTAAAAPRGTSVAVNRTEPTRRFSQGAKPADREGPGHRIVSLRADEDADCRRFESSRNQGASDERP